MDSFSLHSTFYSTHIWKKYLNNTQVFRRTSWISSHSGKWRKKRILIHINICGLYIYRIIKSAMCVHWSVKLILIHLLVHWAVQQTDMSSLKHPGRKLNHLASLKRCFSWQNSMHSFSYRTNMSIDWDSWCLDRIYVRPHYVSNVTPHLHVYFPG